MNKQAKTAVAKPRLGRGLSSLITNSVAAEADAQYIPAGGAQPAPIVPAEHATQAGGPIDLAIDDIVANPFQPRREFRPEELQQLADSIAQQGILQPLVVSKGGEVQVDKPYVLIAGERRLRAAKLAGLTHVPCVIKQATRQQMLEWALVENIQRADLNPIDKAKAYRDYIDRFSLTQADAATRLAQPRATVANYLRILDLPTEVQRLIVEDRLSFGHAKVLAGLVGQAELQVALANRVAAQQLSVRQLEELAGQTPDPLAPAAPAAPERPGNKPPYLRDLEEQLTTVVGTKVNILPGRAKHSGRIVIHFYNLDDFDRVSASLGLKVQN